MKSISAMTMSKKAMIVLVTMALALPALGGVRLGARGGITVGEMRFERNLIDSDNRVGYTAGLLLDINIPVVGLGVEASLMYTHRNTHLTDGTRTFKRQYLDIPLMARYRLELPAVKRVVMPFVFTGPCLSVLFDDNMPSTDLDNSHTILSWDVGGGVDLFNRVRLSATYGLGISKAMSYIDREYTGTTVSGKDRYWTLSAAWLF